MDKETIQCWQCGTQMTLDELSSNDGDCPECEVEIALSEYLSKALSDNQALRALLASEGGEEMEVVAYLNTASGEVVKYGPTLMDWDDEKAPVESLMTVAQHQRILAAATHPADQVEDDLTMVKVSRELLERIIKRGMRLPDETQHQHLEELRALLAKP